MILGFIDRFDCSDCGAYILQNISSQKELEERKKPICKNCGADKSKFIDRKIIKWDFE